MTINDYLKSNFSIRESDIVMHEFYGLGREDTLPARRPIIKCADGFSMSVQADAAMYCSPRTTLFPDNWGDGYESVEIGFPTAEEPMIMEYAEDPDDPTGTVYGWVPVEIVDAVIQKHGGIELM